MLLPPLTATCFVAGLGCLAFAGPGFLPFALDLACPACLDVAGAAAVAFGVVVFVCNVPASWRDALMRFAILEDLEGRGFVLKMASLADLAALVAEAGSVTLKNLCKLGSWVSTALSRSMAAS